MLIFHLLCLCTGWLWRSNGHQTGLYMDPGWRCEFRSRLWWKNDQNWISQHVRTNNVSFIPFTSTAPVLDDTCPTSGMFLNITMTKQNEIIHHWNGLTVCLYFLFSCQHCGLFCVCFAPHVITTNNMSKEINIGTMFPLIFFSCWAKLFSTGWTFLSPEQKHSLYQTNLQRRQKKVCNF